MKDKTLNRRGKYTLRTQKNPIRQERGHKSMDLKSKQLKNSEKDRGTLLSVHAKDYEYWKKKIYEELFCKKGCKNNIQRTLCN